MTYFLPTSSGHSPAKTAATPEAPPPSTTAFSISIHLKMLIATHSSDTVTILSISGAAVATALHPTVGTVRPSAMLAVVGVKTGVPAFRALEKLGHRSGSTP